MKTYKVVIEKDGKYKEMALKNSIEDAERIVNAIKRIYKMSNLYVNAFFVECK